MNNKVSISPPACSCLRWKLLKAVQRVRLDKDWIVPTRYNGAPINWTSSIMSGMKFVEATGAPLFNGNEWANTSLIQSKPL